MDTPLVSVILATYNGSRYIREAIDSVLVQDFLDFELIIVDDASTDKILADILDEYARVDTRVHIFRNEKNMERSWSKNFGVSQSKGKYIAFIDDDDIWEVSKLTEQSEVLEKNQEIGLVGTYVRFIDESGVDIGTSDHLYTGSEEILKNILISNQFIQSSVMIRTDIFKMAGGFPEFNLCEDYDLWLRALCITHGENLKKVLVRYRVRTTSTTGKNLYRMKTKTIGLVWRYRKFFPHFFRAFSYKLISFPFNISFLLNVFKKCKTLFFR